MEKDLYQIYFQNRLCNTLLRLSWLMVFASLVPVLLKLMLALIVMGSIIYLMILIVLTICSFFLLLLNEDFRALFAIKDYAELSNTMQEIYDVYQKIMPMLIIGVLAFSCVSILMLLREQGFSNRAGRMTSAILSIVVMTIAAIVFYAYIG